MDHLIRRRGTQGALCACLLLTSAAMPGLAQGQNPSSATNSFFGSVTAQPATDETLKLSLDDAVRRGLDNNLGLKEAEDSEKTLHGERNQALQAFLPTIGLTATTGFYQHNLAALGFGPGMISKFAVLFPGGVLPAGLSTITKDDLTQGQVHFTETLFSGPVIAGWRAAGAAEHAAHFQKMSAREEVVQQVAGTYLRVIAASSEVDNARALVAQAQVQFDHAHEAHLAGTVANLEELRARVQLQAQQQALIYAQNSYDKELILLKREIGIAPGQKIALTDPAPYSDLAEQTPEEVRAVAYRNRQDYQTLRNLLAGYKAIHSSYRSQRLPTLRFDSYFGTSTVAGSGTRSDFVAAGTLTMPLFREAKLRGDEQASQAQVDAVNAQLNDLTNLIDKQVRSALLDVHASEKLVEVARSNVDLATRALSDETDRVNAGVDDNLPLVTAQSSLASAENNLVESLYQYNVSKLALARSAGVLEEQYRAYLGK